MTSLRLRTADGLLALLRLPGIGPARTIWLAGAFETTDELRDADPNVLLHMIGRRLSTRDFVKLDAPPLAADGIRRVGYFDDDYPPGLRDLPVPPPVLWVVGTLPDIPSVAIVGTRHADKTGLIAAQRVAAGAVEAGLGVVSGLAIGIDAAAQNAAVESGGRTWAILGGGVDRPTPIQNADLAARIVQRQGGLIAEVAPGSRTTGRALVARDRLQAALSRATVVVQSGIPSGTLHTVRFTLELRRPLAVLAPPADSLGNSSWAANEALIDPKGFNPSLLGARGHLADWITLRRPVADLVVRGREDYPRLWAIAKGDWIWRRDASG